VLETARRCGWPAAVIACAFFLSACGAPAEDGRSGAPPRAKLLNLYIFSDYLAPNTLTEFEKQTGIKVSVSYYDTNETLETRLLTGHSGFDVVVPTSPFFERQIKAGIYRNLDKSKLPNLKNIDPALMAKVSAHDPDNAHGVIYMWGTLGVGYNENVVKALLPNAPLDSWRMVFDPAVTSKLARCGISMLDAAPEMMRAVLAYLHRDPNSQNPADLAAAEQALQKARPYIRNIDSNPYVDSMANGDLCVAAGFNGAIVQARDRAREANKGFDIVYVVPKEGSVLWFDMMAIPKDAPNPDSAYAFLNYMMTPRAIADVSNTVRYANANTAAGSLVLPEIRHDPAVYPPPELRDRLAGFLSDTPEQNRAITRLWQAFKSGSNAP
jgi:putrescine transport system substrate-binding protein